MTLDDLASILAERDARSRRRRRDLDPPIPSPRRDLERRRDVRSIFEERRTSGRR